jgi:D-psicose/D-tagatose/L-ribulose 3-epimerase
MPFEYSICNEMYRDRPFAEACRAIHRAGYTGIEIAPFTLAENPAEIPGSARRECRDAMEAAGARFVGLHWLLVSPAGLHITTPDRAVRERSWEFFLRMIDLCADLGPRGLIVLGSPRQRAAVGGMTSADGVRVLADGLARVAPQALERGVTVLLEALPGPENDVVTSLDEAAALVRQIGSPAVRTMFDCHNAVAEREPHAALIERHFDVIRHVHINEMDGRHPGTGAYDFRPVLGALARRGYAGWLSLEVFDFSAGADRIAADSLRYLQNEVAKLQ